MAEHDFRVRITDGAGYRSVDVWTADGSALGGHSDSTGTIAMSSLLRAANATMLRAMDRGRAVTPPTRNWRCGCGPGTIQIECPYHGGTV